MKHLICLFFFGCINAPPLWASGQIDCNALQAPPNRAWCLLQDYKALKKQGSEPFALTKKMIKEADAQFNAKNYNKAYDAYDLAWLNSPNVYAYLRQGDSSLYFFATASTFQDIEGKATGSCLLPSKMVAVIDAAIENNYETGIELAKLLKTSPPVSPAMLAAAAEKVMCLKSVANQYRKTSAACVDRRGLRACMGLQSSTAK